MTCPKCGKIIDNNQAVFCSDCGTRLVADKREEYDPPDANKNIGMPETESKEEQEIPPQASIPSPDSWRQDTNLNRHADPASSGVLDGTETKVLSEWNQVVSDGGKPSGKRSVSKVVLVVAVVIALIIVAVVMIAIRFLNWLVYLDDLETISEFAETVYSDSLLTDNTGTADDETFDEPVVSDDTVSNTGEDLSSAESQGETDSSTTSGLGTAWIPLPSNPEREEVLIGSEDPEEIYSEESYDEGVTYIEPFYGLSIQPEYVFEEGYRDYCIVNTNNDNLNIRSGPGTDYDILGKAPKDAILTIVGYIDAIDDWILIDYDGAVGWVSSEYLALLG